MSFIESMATMMTPMQVRIITGLALSVLGLCVIFLFPAWAFVGFTALLTLGVGYEWFRLSCQRNITRWLALGMVALFGAGLYLLLPSSQIAGLALLTTLGWMVLMFGLWRHRQVAAATRSAGLRTGLGLFILPAFWFALIQIRALEQGAWLLLFGILIVAVADTLAYFVGRALGRHKLAPALSPGKTLEGLVGGLVGVGILAAIGVVLPLFSSVPAWELALWSMLVALFSVAGDLEESRLKREAGVKDSGQLLPGHGGLLDRLDGQLAAMPIWLLALAQMHLLIAS
ncbi:MAG: phosphatidate cytidylyltransferase [Halothiobacillus sp.]